MAKSHKSCMEQPEVIDTFGTYQSVFGMLVLNLGSFATVLFVLVGFILFRVGIFGFVRLGVLDDSIHEFSHVLDRSLESAKLVDQRLELAIPFQDNHCCLSSNSV